MSKADTEKRRQKAFHFIIWLFIGFVCVVSVSAAHLTHAGLFDDFYNVGRVRDFPQWNLEVNVAENEYAVGLPIDANDKKWKFLVLTVEEANADNIAASFELYKIETGELIAAVEAPLSNGRNIVKIPNQKFGSIVMRINGQAGKYFKLVRFQLRQKKPISNLVDRMMKRCVFFGAIYVVVSCCIAYLFRKSKICAKRCLLQDYLTDLFRVVGNSLLYLVNWIPKRLKRFIRSGIFLFLLLFCNATSVKQIFHIYDYQRTILFNILLFIIAFLCLEKRDVKQVWHSFLCKAWFGLAILMIISDIFVKKHLMYNGVVILIVFGFLAYAWNTMHTKEELIIDFLRAVHIYFVGMTLYCFIYRPDIYGRYIGSFSNAVTFAAYCTIIAVAALSELTNAMSKRRFNGKTLFFVIEFLVSCSFMWKSQTRCGLLALLIVLILIIIRQVKVVKQKRYVIKSTVLVMITAAILAMPIYYGTDYALNHFSGQIGVPSHNYETDPPILEMSGMEYQLAYNGEGVRLAEEPVIAEQEESVFSGILKYSRVLDSLKSKDLEVLTSGRTIYWKSYLRSMNLLGHFNYADVMGSPKNAHSALLLVPYRFGIFTFVTYFLMIIFACYRSFKYMFSDLYNKEKSYVMLPIMLVVAYLVFAWVDVLEYLYSGFLWMSFYMILGILFDDNNFKLKKRTRLEQYYLYRGKAYNARMGD